MGAGTYGDVWLATDAVGKHVAVKVIDRERLALISQTNREERGLSLIRTQLPEHDHLIRVHHVGNDESRLYYVMDLADPSDTSEATGLDVETYRPRTLQGQIAIGNAMQIMPAIEIIRQLLDAVACLHENGVVHRDIKPANILCVDGVWKLADIGLMAEEHPLMTTVGTPDFMPPGGKIDRTADLYALGKLLYCLVTGNPASAFPLLPGDLLNVDQRWAISELNEVITRACHPRRESRFASAKEFDAALESCLHRIASGKPRISRRMSFSIAGVLVLCLIGAAWYATTTGLLGLIEETDEAEWIELFNGRDLAGWFKRVPHHGEWYVEDGAIRCKRDEKYKSLLYEKEFGPGVIRATIIPAHDGAGMGIGYLCPHGPIFMFMGDKYTWIRGNREKYPPEEPLNWLSFPGPILRANEPAELEIRYGPSAVILSVNGVVLQELEGIEGSGQVGLHVWKDDAGAFRDIPFRAADNYSD